MRRMLNRWFPVGTRSVLFGAHCFFIHPWFVAAAWWRLYGFPRKIQLWVAFFVHDLGYVGKPNMDGPEGESHPEFGAALMHRWFDRFDVVYVGRAAIRLNGEYCESSEETRIAFRRTDWLYFALYHSRFYARRDDQPFSPLCVADKLAVSLEPWWLYLPRVWLSGELAEYMAASRSAALGRNKIPGGKYSGEKEVVRQDQVAGLGPYRAWHKVMSGYCRAWAYEHADGRDDSWTPARKEECRAENRHG